jgi:hypothetical protein
MGVCFTKKKSEEVVKLSGNEKVSLATPQAFPNQQKSSQINENKILNSGIEKPEAIKFIESDKEINEVKKDLINEPILTPPVIKSNEIQQVDKKLDETLEKLIEKVSEEKGHDEEEVNDYKDYEPLFNLV